MIYRHKILAPSLGEVVDEVKPQGGGVSRNRRLLEHDE
jgi:hypothetical protein